MHFRFLTLSIASFVSVATSIYANENATVAPPSIVNNGSEKGMSSLSKVSSANIKEEENTLTWALLLFTVHVISGMLFMMTQTTSGTQRITTWSSIRFLGAYSLSPSSPPTSPPSCYRVYPQPNDSYDFLSCFLPLTDMIEVWARWASRVTKASDSDFLSVSLALEDILRFVVKHMKTVGYDA